MKNIMLLVICFTCVQSFGQTPKLNMDKVRKYMEQNRLFLDTTAAKKPTFLKRTPGYNAGAGPAAFSHTTSLGDVYILPQDNMPCLQPNTNLYRLSMPGAATRLLPLTRAQAINKMPNGYNEKPLLPNLSKK